MKRLLATIVATLAALAALAPAAHAAPASMPSAAQLDAYLAGKGSPMAGEGPSFVASGGRWQVDPRLLVAIAGAESNFGAITCAPFNAWGWGCPNGPYEFDSWADGIDAVAEGLRTNYLAEGRTTVALINLKYAPIGAANDPTGLNNHWTTNVSRFLLELGGDPNDVDIAGIAGSLPLGVATDPAALQGFQFVEEDQPDAAAEKKADQLVVAAGRPRSLVIRVRNVGSNTWRTEDVRLRRVDLEQRVGGAPYGALEAGGGGVAPGEVARFAVDLAAVGSSDGVATTRWRLEGPGGPFGPELVRTVRFEVPAFVAGDSRVEVAAANSGVAGGEPASTVIVHVRNAGSATWIRDGEDGVLLGVCGASGQPLAREGWINGDVAARMLEREAAPGEEASFAFRVRGTDGAIALRPFTTSSWATGAPVVVRVGAAPVPVCGAA